MTTSTVIIVAIVIATGVAVNLLLGGKTRSNVNRFISKKRSSQRSTDRRVLTTQEKQILKRAKQIAKRGEYRQASQLLEQIGFHREAISMLEDAKLIDEAATILLKMRRPNRAGVVYARHGQWSKGAECFKQAGMPVEAAKCLRECERYAEAANLFMSANKHDEAASCLVSAKSWQKAGQIYLKLGEKEKATKVYDALLSTPGAEKKNTFDATEIDFMQDLVESGSTHSGFLKVLAANGRTLEMIRLFIEKGDVKKALDAYNMSPIDLGPMLMSEINTQSEQATHLAIMFQEASKPRYAGMVYEQMSDFATAAERFEEAGEFERASYCWERSGDRKRAKNAAAKCAPHAPDKNDLKLKQTVPSKKIDLPSAPGAGVFTIETNTTQAQQAPIVASDRMIFEACPLFEGLDSSQREKIWAVGRIENFQESAKIYTEKDVVPGIYIVIEGIVEKNLVLGGISTKSNLQFSELFGHKSILADETEGAAYEAKSSCRLLFLERGKFIKVLEQDGRLAHQVYKSFTALLLQAESNQLKPKLNLLAS